jgi:hypothetical protein
MNTKREIRNAETGRRSGMQNAECGKIEVQKPKYTVQSPKHTVRDAKHTVGDTGGEV